MKCLGHLIDGDDSDILGEEAIEGYVKFRERDIFCGEEVDDLSRCVDACVCTTSSLQFNFVLKDLR